MAVDLIIALHVVHPGKGGRVGLCPDTLGIQCLKLCFRRWLRCFAAARPASIRRQLKHGATDPYSIAFEAFKALAERSERAERRIERGKDWPTNAATAK